MYRNLIVTAIVPARNEELAIGKVVSDLTTLGGDQRWIDRIIVCDNGSTDNTAAIAADAGALVVHQPQPGYGQACLTAIATSPICDIILFVDGDDSCFVSQAERLLEGIYRGADLTIGSRALGKQQPGSLTMPQRFGNWLATALIGLLWSSDVSDLGPFRAIRCDALKRINMQDQAFGWTVEMQVKAIQQGLAVAEYPVDSKVRIGKSKVSGSLKGIIGAAHGILGTIIKLRLSQKTINIKSQYTVTEEEL